MLLAIEAGNTNIKFALVNEDGSPRARWRIATDAAAPVTNMPSG